MKYLVTGGGTGGHIYPALAIANALKDNDPKCEILYVGTEKGLESELVPKEGIEFKTVRVRGLPRKINKEFFVAIKDLFLGLRDSRKIINDFRPDVVIGTGGYVCGPVVFIASRKKNIKTMIHEQNAYPGITNKILSRYVDKVAVTFDEATKYFKYPDKVVKTGNPIRKSIINIKKDDAYERMGIDRNRPFILSFGGSGGQKKLNDGILKMIEKNSKENKFQHIHITGKRLYDNFMKDLETLDIEDMKDIKVMPYLYDMPEAINIADLVITSAGAITLAEIAAAEVPSILVPKGYTAENHQEFNARVFYDKGASLLLLEKDIEEYSLSDKVFELIDDKEKLNNMKLKTKELGNVNAADLIVAEIKGLL